MRKREQTYKLYSNEVRKEAVRLHEEDKWTYKQITEKYGIQDKDRVRKWVYKFRKQGEYGLLDNRGRREEYIDKDRYNQTTSTGEYGTKKVLRNLETGGVKGKYAIIEELSDLYPVTLLCELLDVWRSAYYRYLKRKQADPDGVIKQLIKTIYLQRERTYGYRRIQGELERQYNETVNHKKVLRLMQEMGIRSIIRVKRPYFNNYQTAQSDGRVSPNLLDREFTATKPNLKWVTDITQYRIGEQRLYLSAIKDLCGNDIVAFHISTRNNNELVLNTFAKAFKQHKDASGKIADLIVHSDQGSQYTSHEYHNLIPKVGAQISMSRRGNCIDNAAMESFFSHLKTEALYPYDISSISEAQQRIEEFIRFYNNERIQIKLKKQTPIEYRLQFTA